jgi:hypothetical protein
MVMTDDEIASAAARRGAARRARVRAVRARCGAEFEGLATRRYCSDRCRVEAARARARPETAAPAPVERLTEDDLIQRPGEDAADHVARLRQEVFGDRVFDSDVVEDPRRADEELSRRYRRPFDRRSWSSAT